MNKEEVQRQDLSTPPQQYNESGVSHQILNKLTCGKQILIYLLCNGQSLVGMLDTGSTVSLVNSTSLDLKDMYQNTDKKFTAANGGKVELLGEQEVVINIQGWSFPYTILVAKGLDTNALILGTDFMETHKSV